MKPTLLLMPEAENALYELAIWIENKNTPGSGMRFVNKFLDRINTYNLPEVKYSLCHHSILAEYDLSCVTIDKWVVAFKQNKHSFVVHYILYGPALS